MPANLFPWIIAIPVAALAMTSVIVWLGLRSEQARTEAQRDVQLALLQKFSSGDDLARFLATEEGKQMIDKLSLDNGKSDPRKKTVEMLTGALVTLFLGIGFCVMGPKAPIFFIPGIICLAVGVGLLVAAAVAHRVSKKLGLIPAK